MASVMTYRISLERIRIPKCTGSVPSTHNPSVCLFIYRVRIHGKNVLTYAALPRHLGLGCNLNRPELK